MISSVSAANDTDDNAEILNDGLQPGNDPDLIIVGAYVKYPMQNFGDDAKIAEETYYDDYQISNENDTRKVSSFRYTVVNTTTDGNITLKLTGNANMTGQIYFSFLKTPLNLTNGKVEYQLTNLQRGYYNFTFHYTGDANYQNGTRSTSFIIPSTSTIIENEIDNFTMIYKDGSEFKVTLKDQWGTPLSGKNVNFNINNVMYHRTTDENGSASIRLNLDPGKYDIITHYRGTRSTTGNLTHTNVTILPTINGENIKKLYKNDTQYFVKVTDNAGNPLINQSVRFNINGVFYNRTSNEEGIARLNINLHDGTYIITSENLYDNCRISNNITVLPTIISEDLIKIYKNASQFNVKVLKTDGTPLANSYVTFNINGVFYNRSTDNEGNARLNINLHPGKYTITTENHYDGSRKSNTIIVTPYLYTDDLTKYYKSSSRFEAKLVDSNYNPQANMEITFIINGVEYKRNTDESGKASIAINLQPGEYQITTKNAEYEVSNTILVLPTLIDLNTNNAIIDYDENETYNVLVLDGNGNPFPNQTVQFKYLNQIEKITTDKNGIAKFEGIRVNQYNKIEIEYNGYSLSNNVKFKIYPDTMIGNKYGNTIEKLPQIAIETRNIY